MTDKLDTPALLDVRLSGLVDRYHTWPTHTRQSVGEHSWQVARIILSIAPGDYPLLVAALLHDVGELAVGDTPFPAKQASPLLRDLLHNLEDEHTTRLVEKWMPGVLDIPGLDDRQVVLLKLADIIDMLEFGMHERVLGNNHAAIIIDRCLDFIEELMEKPELSELDKNRVTKYLLTRMELFLAFSGGKLGSK